MKNNIPESIENKIGKGLHNNSNHPIGIIKNKIYSYFGEKFAKFDNLCQQISIHENFDCLLIPQDHPSRKASDTYFVDENNVLRTHTSAHQNALLKAGFNNFLVTGDVFRRDEIDRTHYPVFHQMEGVKIIDGTLEETKVDLLNTLSGLVNYLFPNCQYKVVDSYFPFTKPSFEIEVLWNGKWIEVLGCGVIHPEVLKMANREGQVGWAFGLGLERLAMILFEIPDIRLFWTDDKRFHEQFKDGNVVKFEPYSKYPACYKDIAFWIDESFEYNDFCELARETGGDKVESIELIDEFTHPKTGLKSHCYRVNYRSNEDNLTNEEVNEMFFNLRNLIVQKLKLKLR